MGVLEKVELESSQERMLKGGWISGYKLQQGNFLLDLKKKIIRMVRYWGMLLRGWELPFLDVSKMLDTGKSPWAASPTFGFVLGRRLGLSNL